MFMGKTLSPFLRISKIRANDQPTFSWTEFILQSKKDKSLTQRSSRFREIELSLLFSRTTNYMVRPGFKEASLQEVISELGIFGYIIG